MFGPMEHFGARKEKLALRDRAYTNEVARLEEGVLKHTLACRTFFLSVSPGWPATSTVIWPTYHFPWISNAAPVVASFHPGPPAARLTSPSIPR